MDTSYQCYQQAHAFLLGVSNISFSIKPKLCWRNVYFQFSTITTLIIWMWLRSFLKSYFKIWLFYFLYNHVFQFRAQLNWLPIRLRRDMHILTFLFKILNYQNFPAYLRSRFNVLPIPSRSKRSCVIPSLDIPKSKTKYLQKSFSVYASSLWNQLPNPIQKSPSLMSFKSQLKKHLFASEIVWPSSVFFFFLFIDDLT